MFTTPLAALGDVAPALWLVVARAGGLLAVVLVYRLTVRLASTWASPAAARVGGGLAALALLGGDWLRYVARGESEPMVLALLLWAIERHLDGRHGHALVLGALAGLGRPEVWPFLGLYWVWAWRREPATRPVILASAAGLGALWVGLDWWGSGTALSAGERAHRITPGSLADDEHPALAVLARAAGLAIPPVVAGALVAVALAVRERRRAVLLLAGAAAAWVALVAGLTQAGYTGNERYLFPVAGVLCVLGGAAFARLTVLAGPSRAVAAGAVLAATGLPFLPGRAAALVGDLRETANQEVSRGQLHAVVERAGGPRRLLAEGRPAVTRGGFQPVLAWELRVSLAEVSRPFPPEERLPLALPGVVFDGLLDRPDPKKRPWLGRPDLSVRPLARVGFWRVLSVAAPARAPATAAARRGRRARDEGGVDAAGTPPRTASRR